jgi:hypothetical protein
MTLTEKTPPESTPPKATPAEAPPQAPPSRDGAHWAKPVDRLSAEGLAGSGVDSVTGKRVTSPLQGFGQLWQKTFRVPLEGSTMSPQEVIVVWKERFATFWPSKGKFYAPLAGIVPGEVALLDIAPVPGSPVKFSTGVMVIYADDESFTFISPEGHMLSGWITFSAYRDGDVTVAQVQALERTSDPFDELGLMFGGSRMNDRFWSDTLANVARAMGATEPAVVSEAVCIDKRRQWRRAANIRNSITLRTVRHTLAAPVRWISGRS